MAPNSSIHLDVTELEQWQSICTGLEELHSSIPVNRPLVVNLGVQSAGKSSILSRLSNVPLHIGPRATTLGPTLIESHKTNAPFKAEIFIEFSDPAFGIPKGRVPFTIRPLSAKDNIAHILRLAGDEARRSKDGSRAIRTYEQVTALGEGRKDGPWPEFTANLVVLKVSGDEQPSISVIDLPGIASEKEHANLIELARVYLQKPHTLKVFCVAASGGAPSSDTTEAKLLRECDPRGKSTIGLITKADKLDNVSEDEWGDLIAGENQNFASFQPKFGWWPTRFRTFKEANLTDQALNAVEAQLFAQDDWCKVADRTGKTFGWRAVERIIMNFYIQEVRKHMHELAPRVARLLKDTGTQIDELAPEVDNGVEVLHCEVIPQIADRLSQAINSSAAGSDLLVQLQADFRNDLKDTVPEFVPLLEGHQQDGMTYEPYSTCGWPTGRSIDRTIHLNEIHQNYASYFSARTGGIDTVAIEKLLKSQHSGKWQELSTRYNDAVWESVIDLVSEIVTEVCAQKSGAAEVAIATLTLLTEGFKKQGDAIIKWRCGRELDDPSNIEHRTAKFWQEQEAAVGHYEAQHRKIYGQSAGGSPHSQSGSFCGIHTPGPSRRPSASVQTHHIPDGSPRIPNIDTPPSEWTPEFSRKLIATGVTVVAQLVYSTRRLDSTVGPDIQRLVQDFLKEVPYRLLQAFNLHQVEAHVAKRARDVCEPDAETVRQRDALKRQRTSLEEISQMLQRK